LTEACGVVGMLEVGNADRDTDVDCAPPNNCYDPGNSASTPLLGVLSTSNSSVGDWFNDGGASGRL
jgi:hypothetical protein